MSSYIVLARKWRPQTFADLVGQQHIAVTLQNAIAQNRVAHAFLFTGSRGVGKTSTARIFAKALNCAKAPAHEPCNECESCREITEGRSMDVIEIDGASNRGINEIKEVLDAVRYAPSRDRYKIYIIDEVHMLTTEAFNALLKTLEEPPPHVIFIFATTDPNKVPITIVSRCQRYDFKRIRIDDLVDHLDRIAKSENIIFEKPALQLIARTARGGVRDALSAMDQIIAFAEQPISGERAAEVLGVASRETLLKMAESVIRRDTAPALECIQRVDYYGQNLSQFAFDFLELLRDITVLAAAPAAKTELNVDEATIIQSWLPMTTLDCMQRIFNIWYQTSETLPKSLSPRIVMEMATVKMCQVAPVVPLTGILKKLDAITKALGQNVPFAPDSLAHIQEYLGPEKKNSIDSQVKTFRAPTLPTAPSQTTDTTLPTAPSPTTGPSLPHDQSLSRVPSPDPDHASSPAPAPDPQEAFLNESPWEDRDDLRDDKDNHSDDGLNPPDESLYSDIQTCGTEEPEEDDGDDDNDENPSFSKKMLAVSEDRPKSMPLGDGGENNRPPSAQTQWRQIVDRTEQPLFGILSRARVDCLTHNSAEITIPDAYRGMVTNDHIQIINHILAECISPSCRLSVRYSDIGNEADTLAARKAKAEFEAQQAAFDETKNHPMMQTIIKAFHIDPEKVRFTFNNNRTTK